MISTILQQVPADSLATAVGTGVGLFVTAKIAGLFSLVNKFVTDVANKVVSKLQGEGSKLPAAAQAIIAFAFAQVIAIANAKLALLGGPELSTDLSGVGVGIFGTIIWVASMGAHSFISKVLKLNV